MLVKPACEALSPASYWCKWQSASISPLPESWYSFAVLLYGMKCVQRWANVSARCTQAMTTTSDNWQLLPCLLPARPTFVTSSLRSCLEKISRSVFKCTDSGQMSWHRHSDPIGPTWYVAGVKRHEWTSLPNYFISVRMKR
ncbi:hypothetical protein A8E93_26975 [Burkholderia cenocepacia]|nr:hypothetical protein A8E93_26975 [Burkholderia cenocepacia]ONW46443.1 hypothetical protein A8E92_20925 [Burkholderia cenocepacia]